MSDSKHHHGSAPPGPSPEEKRDSAAPKQHKDALPPQEQPSEKSGRVTFDRRGNPIWEWQTSTGVYDQNVTTQRMKTLEAADLSLADTPSQPRSKGLTLAEPTVLPGDGANPYNSDGPTHKTVSKHLPKLHSHSMSSHKTGASSKQDPIAAPKPLSAWQRLKAKLKRNDEE